MTDRHPACLIFVMILFAVAAVGDARTWTNRDGRKVEADFVSLHDGKVRIRRTDGRLFDVPLDSLSDADRSFVASQTTSTSAPQTNSDPPSPHGVKTASGVGTHRVLTKNREWEILATSAQYARVTNKDTQNVSIELLGKAPSDSVALVLRCVALQKTDMGAAIYEIVEVPKVRLGTAGLKCTGIAVLHQKKDVRESKGTWFVTVQSPRKLLVEFPGVVLASGDFLTAIFAYDTPKAGVQIDTKMIVTPEKGDSVEIPFPDVPASDTATKR